MQPSPFNYKVELRKAREALDERLAAYIGNNLSLGYRELARLFHVSPATISAIAKKYSRERRRGRVPHPDKKVTFFLRYVVKEKELEMNLTVIAPKGASGADIRSAVEECFDCLEITVGGSAKTERSAEYTLNELRDKRR